MSYNHFLVCTRYCQIWKNILSEQKYLVSNKNGLFKQQLSKQMWFLLLSFCHLTLKSGPIYLDYYLSNAKNVMLSKYKCYLFRRTYILKANSQNMITHLFPLPLSISLPLNFPWWFLTCLMSWFTHYSRINYVKRKRDLALLYWDWFSDYQNTSFLNYSMN